MTAAITDFSQFTDLRRAADNNDPAALRDVAGQFEALFLQTMLKSMRDASIGDPLFGENDGHEMFQGMFDQQLAVEMSSGKGIGLADMLVRQLGAKQPESPRDSAVMSMAMPPSGAAAMSTAGAPAMSRPHQRVGQVAERPAEATPGNELQDKVPQDKKRIPDWRDAASFARDVWPHALRVAKRLNVAPVAIMAQAALETGWGKHVVSGRDGTFSNNLFGIKASHGWQGDSVARRTIEYADGIAHQEVAKFRAYDDVAASFDDYFEFLSTNPRYSKVVDSGGGVEGFASAIAASGYATDPAYAEKISRVANSDTMNRVLAPLKNSATVSIND